MDVWLLRDEALVLDEVFRRHRDENRPLEALDEAERSALTALGAAIEGAVLDDVFSDDYTTRIADSRERLLRRERE